MIHLRTHVGASAEDAEHAIQAAPWHRAPIKWRAEADTAFARGDWAEAVNVAMHAEEHVEAMEAL